MRQDLHDGLGAALTALAFQVDEGRSYVTATTRIGLDELLLEMRAQMKGAIDDIRRLVYDLQAPCPRRARSGGGAA